MSGQLKVKYMNKTMSGQLKVACMKPFAILTEKRILEYEKLKTHTEIFLLGERFANLLDRAHSLPRSRREPKTIPPRIKVKEERITCRKA